MPSPLSIRSKAFLGVVLCVGVWGVNYPATKIAYQELSPLAYTGWRFLIAAPLFAAAATAIYALLFRPLDRLDWARAEIATGGLWGLLILVPWVIR